MINQIEPWITDAEVSSVLSCIESTFVTEGKFTENFELKIQQLHKLKYQPVAYANATVALYSALKILGIKPNQEVIIPSITFIATANSVIMAGGVPVCVDVDRNFEMDVEDVKNKINSNTFGIMPVHLYGHFTNVIELRKLCDGHDLYMVEDASQGVGVVGSDGLFAGSVGHIGVLSFYGNKFVTSAQGAMFISNDEKILKKAMRFKNHGRENKGTFFHEDIGFNFCTSDLHSSLGYAQLMRFEEIRLRKLEIFKRYSSNLSKNIDIKMDEINSRKPAYWFMSVFCNDADHVQKFLLKKGIQTRRCFPPLSKQPCYKKNIQIVFSEEIKSTKVYDSYLSLPSKATITNDEIDFVSEELINSM